MSDNSIPLSTLKLEQIISQTAQDLLEKWAIDDRFTEEELTNYAQYAIDDTVFVVNQYMIYFNMVMQEMSLENAEKIITKPSL
jgi:hypothetical protein